MRFCYESCDLQESFGAAKGVIFDLCFSSKSEIREMQKKFTLIAISLRSGVCAASTQVC